MPHTRYDLLGNAACGRKIKELIMAYIKDGVAQDKCMTEIKSQMVDFGILENNFEKEIVPYIDAYYKAKELIDKGYCKNSKVND